MFPFWSNGTQDSPIEVLPERSKLFCLHDILKKYVRETSHDKIEGFVQDFKQRELWRLEAKPHFWEVQNVRLFLDEEYCWKALLKWDDRTEMVPFAMEQLDNASKIIHDHGYYHFLHYYAIRSQTVADEQRKKLFTDTEHKNMMRDLALQAAKLDNAKKELEIERLQMDINREKQDSTAPATVYR